MQPIEPPYPEKFSDLYKSLGREDSNVILIDSFIDLGDDAEEILNNIVYINYKNKMLIIKGHNLAMMRGDEAIRMIEANAGQKMTCVGAEIEGSPKKPIPNE